MTRSFFGAVVTILVASIAGANPPYGGTVFTEPNILTVDDPSAFQSMKYNGIVQKSHWDHRTEGSDRDPEVPAAFYRFYATLLDSPNLTIDVNTEFEDPAQAEYVAQGYAFIAGQMPKILRRNIRHIVVHETGDDWSASSDGEIIIHHGNYQSELNDGVLEESMFHEAVHTSLDIHIEGRRTWLDAQKADDAYISDYAKENPDGEDIAETFLLYFAMMQHKDRLEVDDIDNIQDQIPNRLAFFEKHYPPSKLGH